MYVILEAAVKWDKQRQFVLDTKDCARKLENVIFIISTKQEGKDGYVLVHIEHL